MSESEMNDKLQVTLPPLAEGQTHWASHVEHPFGFVTEQRDMRPLFDRIAYRLLMWLHDRAESFWHWCYKKAQTYGTRPPKHDYGTYSVRITGVPREVNH
jgi:hypothetical protein